MRLALAMALVLLVSPYMVAQSPPAEQITIDAHAATTPFPHFWEQTFGSGRAILSLRQSYRDDLRTVKQATDFQSVRLRSGSPHSESGARRSGRP
jgi:xylan 1,4-beta-xylosidase